MIMGPKSVHKSCRNNAELIPKLQINGSGTRHKLASHCLPCKSVLWLAIQTTVADNNDIPFFSSIEPTKKTESEGQYILVTTKPKLDAAKKAFDCFTENLAKEGILDHFAKPGYSLERINLFKSMKMQMYANGLTAKYKIPGTIEVPKDAPSPHRNAWK